MLIANGDLTNEILDYNQGNQGQFLQAEGDYIDLSAILDGALPIDATNTIDNYIRLERPAAGEGVLLAVNFNDRGLDPIWKTIAILKGIPDGARIDFKIDAASEGADASVTFGNAPGSWSISPGSQSVDEDAGIISFTVTRPSSDAGEDRLHQHDGQ